jgi:hypothetical protein
VAEPITPGSGDIFGELGDSGLIRSAGVVQEEWLRELRGLDGVKRLREMIDNCPITGAILFAIKHLARGVTWDVEPAGQTNEELAQAEFIKECLFTDQSSTWQDTLSEILTFLPYGWAYHEVVYKRRQGPGDDPTTRSRYTDGRIALRKMPLRPQESLWRWEFDETGGVQAMTQWADGKIATIPIQKSLLFRTEVLKGNPEGRSILRNAYITYVRRKRIENQEGIGIERDLAGYPVFTVEKDGPDIWNPNDEAARTWLANIRKLYKSIRRDEQEGMVKPWWLRFELMSGASRRVFDTTAIIERMDRRIAMTVLWDFLLIGHGQTGSFSLVSSRASLAAVSLEGFLQTICDTINRFLIPNLLDLNGMRYEKPPTLKHGAVEAVSLTELGAFLTTLTQSGFKVATLPGMLQYLFSAAKIPVAIPDDYEETLSAEQEAETERMISEQLRAAQPPEQPEEASPEPPEAE